MFVSFLSVSGSVLLLLFAAAAGLYASGASKDVSVMFTALPSQDPVEPRGPSLIRLAPLSHVTPSTRSRARPRLLLLHTFTRR